jgi:hypothetical protein
MSRALPSRLLCAAVVVAAVVVAALLGWAVPTAAIAADHHGDVVCRGAGVDLTHRVAGLMSSLSNPGL